MKLRKRSFPPDRPLLGAALISLTLASAVLASCGGNDGDDAAFTPVDGTESAYCDTFRAWQVHELEGDGDDPAIAGNPAAFEKYWNEYLEFNETSLGQAPPVIRAEWAVSERTIRTVLTPVLEKYDFDVQRIATEGTPAEQALGQPPLEVQKAQDAIHAYENRVCGIASPAAANVVFEADGSSEPYCMAVSTSNSGFETIVSSRFDPDVMRTFVTGDSFSEALEALEEAAPAEIAGDVEAESEWYRTRWSDVLADFDFDYRRILLEGAPEDRAVFNRTHPEVVEHASRVAAYEEQVCTR